MLSLWCWLFNHKLISEKFFVARTKVDSPLSWRLSGFTSDNMDNGCIDIGPMSRRAAMRECAIIFPRAAILHVDDDNHIITYRVAK